MNNTTNTNNATDNKKPYIGALINVKSKSNLILCFTFASIYMLLGTMGLFDLTVKCYDSMLNYNNTMLPFDICVYISVGVVLFHTMLLIPMFITLNDALYISKF